MNHSFIVHGDPVGKGRPRFTRDGRIYTPERTRTYERMVRQAYVESGGPHFGDQQLTVTIMAFFQMPQSWGKKQRRRMDGSFCGKKPDADNLIKSTLDALQGAAYEDDKQVVVVACSKYWSMKGSLYVDIDTVYVPESKQED